MKNNSTGMPELKPCPFCGVSPKEIDNGDGRYFISCENKLCGIQPKTYPMGNSSGMLFNWNTRTAPQSEKMDAFKVVSVQCHCGTKIRLQHTPEEQSNAK